MFLVIQACSMTFYGFKLSFFKKKKIGKFFDFLKICEDYNGCLEINIDPTASNGVSLEPSRPKELKNVEGKIRNLFCPVLEQVFQIFTISKYPPFSTK